MGERPEALLPRVIFFLIMSTIDLVLTVLLICGAYRGYQKGFLVEVLSLISLFAGIVGAFYFLDAATEFLSQYWHSYQQAIPYLAFVMLFAVIIISFHTLGQVIKKVLDMTFLGSLDSLVGAMLGAVKWALGISILLWAMQSTGLTNAEWEQNSQLYPYIASFAPLLFEWLAPYLPQVKELFEEVKSIITTAS
ncbi:MAG: CvpA family protein [Cytophagales bacterium]|nr:CvpA family protein [Cytophagales bacterium]